MFLQEGKKSTKGVQKCNLCGPREMTCREFSEKACLGVSQGNRESLEIIPKKLESTFRADSATGGRSPAAYRRGSETPGSRGRNEIQGALS